MLYYLYELLKDYDIPGWRLMGYITFRSGVAILLSLFIALVIGRKIITKLQRMHIREGADSRNGETKTDKPVTMGGIIIIIATLVPCLLVGDLTNVYMILLLVSVVWLGTIGFMDDYLKLKMTKVNGQKGDGLKGKYKIVGQLGLGLIVGLTMWLSPDITIRENVEIPAEIVTEETVNPDGASISTKVISYKPEDVKSTQTTIPFVKGNNFDYAYLTSWLGKYGQTGGWILFVLVVIIAVTGTSNGANLTDGMDGLCTGVSAIAAVALAIMAYLGGNIIYSHYLNIMYIPGSSELVVFMAAFIGALIGFLWYNAAPAQVYMGDTGSLMIGGVIAVFAILIRKELLLPLLCGIFFAEDLSVILQNRYFVSSRKKYGRGNERRIFKKAPLHHHFEHGGDASIISLLNKPDHPIPRTKIVVRFWIIALFLAVMTFITLKIR